jgi:hypothetical protein
MTLPEIELRKAQIPSICNFDIRRSYIKDEKFDGSCYKAHIYVSYLTLKNRNASSFTELPCRSSVVDSKNELYMFIESSPKYCFYNRNDQSTILYPEYFEDTSYLSWVLIPSIGLAVSLTMMFSIGLMESIHRSFRSLIPRH